MKLNAWSVSVVTCFTVRGTPGGHLQRLNRDTYEKMVKLATKKLIN